MTNKLIQFTKNNNDLFKQYLSLKFEVFVEEMGWSLLPHSLPLRACIEDSRDHNSIFFAVTNCESTMLGVVRGSIPSNITKLYRKELYLDFFDADCLTSMDGRIATVNSLAVKKEVRHSSYPIADQNGIQKTVPFSDALMNSMIMKLHNSGVALIILSAIEGGAYLTMKRAGFKAINPPHKFYGKDYSSNEQAITLKIFDMALAHEKNSELQAYVNIREAQFSDA